MDDRMQLVDTRVVDLSTGIDEIRLTLTTLMRDQQAHREVAGGRGGRAGQRGGRGGRGDALRQPPLQPDFVDVDSEDTLSDVHPFAEDFAQEDVPGRRQPRRRAEGFRLARSPPPRAEAVFPHPPFPNPTPEAAHRPTGDRDVRRRHDFRRAEVADEFHHRWRATGRRELADSNGDFDGENFHQGRRFEESRRPLNANRRFGEFYPAEYGPNIFWADDFDNYGQQRAQRHHTVPDFHNQTCSSNDLNSLRTFVEHLESSIDGWDLDSSNCCGWPGITCGFLSSSLNSTAVVVTLHLTRQRLTGNLSESLGNLGHLRTLNLSHNNLRGSIPQSLMSLPNLETLDLSYNDLSGSFPGNINLPSITALNVSENEITGRVPVEICINSTAIRALSAEDNFFSGFLPVGFGNCSSLEELNLASNSLSGAIPDDLFRLFNLQRLDLRENHFSGRLSGLMGNLSSLVHVDLSSNSLSGNIPDIFDRLMQLQYFSAQSNNFGGVIPTTLSNSPTVVSINLRNNSLSGTIDLNCSALVNLVSIDLASNQFHGSIPENLPNCTRLRVINFARITFSGQVPESFVNFQSLSYMSLSNSSLPNLGRTLEILQHCKNLSTLVLTLNFRDEMMPNNVSLDFSGLRTLVIANCRLTGRVPQWLSGSKNLQLLDLSWNRLEGSIPSWFGNMWSLFYLDLSNNSLTGYIPLEITQMQSLISGNISISMDESLPNFPLFVRRNQTRLKYRRVVSFPPTLELGNNFLTGPVWPEFGNLRELHVLDLKRNNLSGPIPSSLSQMTSLETLDLSFNNLNGTIPSSLTALTFLSSFDVAHNSLSGPIPTDGQFATFPKSSFEGNDGLCGDHGARPCPHEFTPRVSIVRSRRRDDTIVGMGVGIGVGSVILFALVFVIFRLSCRRTFVRQENVDDFAVEKDVDQVSSLVILCPIRDDDDKGTIHLDDLLKATDDFDQSNIIGCGGFGLVYRAVLSDGRKVAIKRLSGDNFQMEREFRAEVETLSRAQHPNLVPLQGYCKHRGDCLLIYSYMENGSLDYWLHEKPDGPASLDWGKRLRIACGAARGLAYLHQSCEPRILHRDIKSSNILLDGMFEARLADFGLARLILPYDTHVTTDLVGTLGYIPPEYSQASVASYKGDVYSFGVVLLELLTGKRPVDVCGPRCNRDLVAWVGEMKTQKRVGEVFDPLVYDKRHAHEMVSVFEIACVCLNKNPRTRPCTGKLVLWLDSIGSTSEFRPKDELFS
ncbi:Phytosulfokine receptor 1 [Striga hermonthica]|uniref:non-specific serine/threonine protein kinase n=1 Tax=Striga hermonthica TaxID=68872 RepID=A0A9N7MHN6_STRHE|nr:Phytosulfokine receptor 1 [Striga hermonthica]